MRCTLVALGFGFVLVAARGYLADLAFGILAAPDAKTLRQAHLYYTVRVLGTPAALSNFVVQAWLIGVQRSGQAMAANLVLNISNALLCVLFGSHLQFGVAGVAAATAVSQYIALFMGLLQICYVKRGVDWLNAANIDWDLVRDRKKVFKMATLNLNIFIRSICLTAILTDFTGLSAALGPAALSGNALLMQLQQLISFGADGFGNAAEAMVGEAIGLGDKSRVRTVLKASFRWCALLGGGFSLVYVVAGETVLNLLTTHEEVVDYAVTYLPWQWAAPLISVTCYLMDGVFVGATRPREMRNATFLACLAFMILGHFLKGSNNGLWGAFLIHTIVRAGVLLWYYPSVEAEAEQRGKQPLLGC